MNKYTTPEEETRIRREESLAERRKQLVDDDACLIEDKADWQVNTTIGLYKLFIAEKTKNIQDAVYLNSILLKDALVSYFKDIHRYKNYSGSLWANKQKQAAYTIKWLVRFRPIQINKEAKIEEREIREILDINLEFALFCGFSFLGTDIFDLVIQNRDYIDLLNKTKEEGEKVDSFYDRLLYDLRYRELSGKKLILVFDALDLVVKSKPSQSLMNLFVAELSK